MGLFGGLFREKKGGGKKVPQQPPSVDFNAARRDAVDVEPVREADSKPKGDWRDAVNSQSKETKAFNKLNVGYEHFKDHPYHPFKGGVIDTNADLFLRNVTEFLNDESLRDETMLVEDELDEPLKGFLGISGSVSLGEVRQAIHEKLLPEINKVLADKPGPAPAVGGNQNQAPAAPVPARQQAQAASAQQKPGPIAFNKLNEAYKGYLKDSNLNKLEAAAEEFRKSMDGIIGRGGVGLNPKELDGPLKGFLKIESNTTMGLIAFTIERFVQKKKAGQNNVKQPQPAVGNNQNQAPAVPVPAAVVAVPLMTPLTLEQITPIRIKGKGVEEEVDNLLKRIDGISARVAQAQRSVEAVKTQYAEFIRDNGAKKQADLTNDEKNQLTAIQEAYVGALGILGTELTNLATAKTTLQRIRGDVTQIDQPLGSPAPAAPDVDEPTSALPTPPADDLAPQPAGAPAARGVVVPVGTPALASPAELEKDPKKADDAEKTVSEILEELDREFQSQITQLNEGITAMRQEVKSLQKEVGGLNTRLDQLFVQAGGKLDDAEKAAQLGRDTSAT